MSGAERRLVVGFFAVFNGIDENGVGLQGERHAEGTDKQTIFAFVRGEFFLIAREVGLEAVEALTDVAARFFGEGAGLVAGFGAEQKLIADETFSEWKKAGVRETNALRGGFYTAREEGFEEGLGGLLGDGGDFDVLEAGGF